MWDLACAWNDCQEVPLYDHKQGMEMRGIFSSRDGTAQGCPQAIGKVAGMTVENWRRCVTVYIIHLHIWVTPRLASLACKTVISCDMRQYWFTTKSYRPCVSNPLVDITWLPALFRYQGTKARGLGLFQKWENTWPVFSFQGRKTSFLSRWIKENSNYGDGMQFAPTSNFIPGDSIANSEGSESARGSAVF